LTVPAPLFVGIGTKRIDLFDQGMTDIAARRTVKPAIGLRFERQQGEDVIDVAQHRARPARPPRPDRRRYVINDRQRGIAGPDPPCHPMGEVGTVDDHKNVRRGLRHRDGGLPDHPQKPRQLLHDRRKSHDRQFFDRKQRGQSFARHRLPADAFEPDGVAKALAQYLHQVRAKPVARFLRRDQKYLSRNIRGCRRRHHAGRPVTKRLAASAVSITA
jgi:hypothetical protein